MTEQMIKRIVAAAIGAIVAMTLFFGGIYTIDETERGVLLRNGAVSGVSEPGLRFKIPLIDSVQRINVKTHTFDYVNMDTYSFDQQQAFLKVSVTLRAVPLKVDALYSKFGSLDAVVSQVVAPAVNQQVKIVFGRYTAVRAIQERGALNGAIKDAISAALKDDAMIIVESVQLEDIRFSGAYLQSIEQRMLAEVEVQKLQQNAEREKVQAQIVVTQANAVADATRAKALANAEATKLEGEAQAAAIEARGRALGNNPNLVTLVQAEKWNGVLPTQMVPGSSVPFLNVK